MGLHAAKPDAIAGPTKALVTLVEFEMVKRRRKEEYLAGARGARRPKKMAPKCGPKWRNLGPMTLTAPPGKHRRPSVSASYRGGAKSALSSLATRPL